MAQIVVVHGIAQEQKGQEVVAVDVKAPLISGIQNALGSPNAPREPKVQQRANDLIDEIRTGGPAMLDAAFYGNLFLEARTDSDDERQLADSFAKAAMARAREDSPRDRTRETADQVLRELEAKGQAQGLGRVLGAAVEQLGRIPGFGTWMFGAVAMIKPTLRQVSRYMLDATTRDAARAVVRRLISPDTKVLIGQSLGSVVAYDVARTLQQPLPLLLTLGSPLGLKKIVYDKLDPQPPLFPSLAQRWVNIADREDFIASTLDLRPFFSGDKPDAARFENFASINNGKEPHALGAYLTKSEVGLAILEGML
jgi:hypothetical protein